MKTQIIRIYDYMQKYGSLTSKEAQDKLGVARLAARISEMRRDGVPIKKEMVKSKNRYGETVYFARYSFDKEEVI